MSVAAKVRAEVEAALAQRVPSALTPSPRILRPTAPTGIVEVDDLVGTGLPIGAISEIVGPESSGRTSLSLAFVARLTRQGKVCAWVDVSDALDPESAAAAGVQLERLLWIRCGVQAASASVEHQSAPQQEFATPQTRRVHLGGNSPHPRTESKGLPTAIGDLLSRKAKFGRDKTIGTPGAPNRPLTTGPVPGRTSLQEQVASDRLPPRRGAYVLEQREAYEPRCAEPQRRPRPQPTRFSPAEVSGPHRPGRHHGGPRCALLPNAMARLDQALRVTDLLLQAGGFSAIVLDMGGIAPEFASRVPLATWFRYRAAAERTQSSFLLLTQHPCAKSGAGVVLRLDFAQPCESGLTVFAGLRNRVAMSRRRFEQETDNVVSIRKPPQRENAVEWRSRTTWAGRQ